MAHTLHHAMSSVDKFGGCIDDYLKIHQWFDESKQYYGDVQHRAYRHHSQGIFECERIFGITILNSDKKEIPVRFIGEQHMIEDFGKIPTLQDWLQEMPKKGWMLRSQCLSKKYT